MISNAAASVIVKSASCKLPSVLLVSVCVSVVPTMAPDGSVALCVAKLPSPVMVPAACVPVWLALASNVASELFAVALVAMPSSLLLSVADIEPAAPVVAALIEMAGVAPPLLTIGAVPVTLVTGAVPLLAAVNRPAASTVKLP